MWIHLPADLPAAILTYVGVRGGNLSGVEVRWSYLYPSALSSHNFTLTLIITIENCVFIHGVCFPWNVGHALWRVLHRFDLIYSLLTQKKCTFTSEVIEWYVNTHL